MLLRADRLITTEPALDAREPAQWIEFEGSTVQRIGHGTPPAPAIELPGCTIIPGLVDHHCHATSWASQRVQPRLDPDATFDDLVELVEREAERNAADAWIIATGWTDEMVGAFDTAAAHQLRRAAGSRFLALTSRDGHGLITTPATLDHVGLSYSALERDDGVVERDALGAPTGILREESAWIVRRRVPQQPTSALLRDAARAAARRGLICLEEMDGARALEHWRDLYDCDGALPINVVINIGGSELDDLPRIRALTAPTGGQIRVGRVKLFADGTLGSGTALLHAPEHATLGSLPRRGVAITSTEALAATALRAAQHGLTLCVHAIGDRAVTNVIDALELTRDSWALLHQAPRIEHAQLMRTEDITRCAQLGIELSVQPAMLVSDRDAADAHWGAERTQRAFALRTMLDAGCTIRFGSDAPIEPLAPLAAIHAAVHRDGGAHELGPMRGAWHPRQRISPLDALAASVASPLAPGAPASLVVLSNDPLVDTGAVRPVATIHRGELTAGSLGGSPA